MQSYKKLKVLSEQNIHVKAMVLTHDKIFTRRENKIEVNGKG